MSLALARALVLTEVVPWGPVAQALFVSVTKSVPFIQALLQTDAVSVERLEEELSRADVPVAENVEASRELLELLPRGLCTRLLAIPLRKEDGRVDVAHATRIVDGHIDRVGRGEHAASTALDVGALRELRE